MQKKKETNKKVTKKETNKKEIEIDEETKVEEAEETNSSKIIKAVKDLIPYVIILIIVILIRTFFITPIMVSGPSMNPTLEDSDVMILNKRASIDRFDIVVVDAGTEPIIKRVIALPGEKIKCANNKVYVNYHLQEENYSQGNTCATESSEFEYELKDNEYFVMGDNRGNSADSRMIGPVTKDQILGTTNLILFPFNRFGHVE